MYSFKKLLISCFAFFAAAISNDSCTTHSAPTSLATSVNSTITTSASNGHEVTIRSLVGYSFKPALFQAVFHPDSRLLAHLLHVSRYPPEYETNPDFWKQLLHHDINSILDFKTTTTSDINNMTALHIAANNLSDYTKIDLLLQYANLNASLDTSGASALFRQVIKAAAESESDSSTTMPSSSSARDIAEYLLEKGASLDICSVVLKLESKSGDAASKMIHLIDVYLATLRLWKWIDRLHQHEDASTLGRTALTCALHITRPDVYEPLIENVLLKHYSLQAHPFATSTAKNRITPLIYATKHLKSDSAVKYLVQLNLKCNSKTAKIDCVGSRVESSSRHDDDDDNIAYDWLDVNRKDVNGNTALMYACQFGLKRDTIHSLIRIPHLDVNIQNWQNIFNDGETSVSNTVQASALSRTDSRFYSVGAKNCPEGCRMHQGESALLLAVMFGNIEAAEALVMDYSRLVFEKKIAALNTLLKLAQAGGYSASQTSKYVDSIHQQLTRIQVGDIDALRRAASFPYGNFEMLEEVIRQAAIDVFDMTDNSSKSLVLVKNSELSWIKRSLSEPFLGMNIISLDYFNETHPDLTDIGSTPLLMAANGCDASMIKLLLENGADTTTHIEFGNGQYSDIIDLIRARATVEAGDVRAEKCRDSEDVIQNGYHTNRFNLLFAADLGYKDTLRSMVKEHGFDVDMIGGFISHERYRGVSALMIAVAANNVDLVEFLIQELHANVDLMNDDELTALTFAIRLNLTEMVQLLLDLGANADLGHPSMIFTAMYVEHLDEKIMSMLLKSSTKAVVMESVFDKIVEIKINADNGDTDVPILRPSSTTAMAFKYFMLCENQKMEKSVELDVKQEEINSSESEVRKYLELKLKISDGVFQSDFIEEILPMILH